MSMKYAIVTGSTKGIGKAISEKLLNNDCFLFLNYAHDDISAANVQHEFEEKYPGRFLIIKADLSTHEGLEDYIGKVKAKTKSLNYVILNVGATNRGTIEEVTWESWNNAISTNITIPFFMIKECKPLMQTQGSILFVSSFLGFIPHATSTAYGTSKAALSFMAKCLVKEFVDLQITVNAIAPGFVDTDWHVNKPETIKRNIENKIALGRFAHPNEIAELSYHMLTNRYINGAIYNIDGGYDYK